MKDFSKAPLRRLGLAALIVCLLLFSGCQRKDVPAPSPSPEPTPEVTPEPTVPLGGWDYAEDTRAIFLSSEDVSETELRAALAQLPALKKLEYPKCAFDVETQLNLVADFPQVEFTWPVRWAGQTNPNDAKTLDLRANTPDLSELQRCLPLFCALETVDLGTTLLTNEQARALAEAFPGTEFLHVAELYGEQYPSRVEEIDLSHIEMEDTETVEAALIHFPHLKKVRMEYCGLDNETMDDLNCRYEDIRFVWVVQVLNRAVPTDSTWYIQYNLEPCYLPGYLCDNLKYCTDIIALDLGHVGLGDSQLTFLPYLTKIRYLILAEAQITDLTPLSNMKDLEYLEIFSTPVKDLSPLLECPNLKDINISRCFQISEESVDVLIEMTQLERIWLHSPGPYQRLKAAKPDCLIQVDTNMCIGLGWQQHPRYYAMRDALHMYYMW